VRPDLAISRQVKVWRAAMQGKDFDDRAYGRTALLVLFFNDWCAAGDVVALALVPDVTWIARTGAFVV
jgi:hypothetical protein